MEEFVNDTTHFSKLVRDSLRPSSEGGVPTSREPLFVLRSVAVAHPGRRSGRVGSSSFA
jgi:hypothetical protein